MHKILLFGFFLLFSSPSIVFSASNGIHISVIGEGKTMISPDSAILNLSVNNEAKTPGEAFKKNSEIIGRVITSIKSYGIEEADLQTNNIYIYPMYDYPNQPEGKQSSELIGYQIVSALSVHIRNLTKINQIIEKAFDLGINQGGNITFVNENKESIAKTVMKKALLDAQQKAKSIAESLGMKLVSQALKITQIDTAQNKQNGLQTNELIGRNMENNAIQTGENLYEAQLKVEYFAVK